MALRDIGALKYCMNAKQQTTVYEMGLGKHFCGQLGLPQGITSAQFAQAELMTVEAA